MRRPCRCPARRGRSLTYSCDEFVGRNCAPIGPGPAPGTASLVGHEAPVEADRKLSSSEVSSRVPTSRRRSSRTARRRRRSRPAAGTVEFEIGCSAAQRVEPEAGVVAAAVAGVRDVDQVAVRSAMLTGSMPPDDTGEPTSVGTPLGDEPQHGDLVAAGIGDEQVAPVGRALDRALRPEAAAEAGATGRERRAGGRRQRAVGVAVERRDRVGDRRIVVDVGVTDDPRRGSAPAAGAAAATAAIASVLINNLG